MDRRLWTGDEVESVGGENQFRGPIVAKFEKLSGAIRYVAENDRGILHIFRARDLRKATGDNESAGIEAFRTLKHDKLRIDIQEGTHDINKGRFSGRSVEEIIATGKKQLKARGQKAKGGCAGD